MAGSEQVGLQRRRPRPLRGRGVGADAHQRHRPRRLHPPAGCGDRSSVPMCSSSPPEDHDRLVAVVSHVPHLVAATLMNAATVGAEQDRRAAAAGRRGVPGHDPGGGRASGDLARHLRRRTPAPSSARSRRWSHELTAMRDRVAGHDRESIFGVLQRASLARRNLPARMRAPRQPLRAAHPGARPAAASWPRSPRWPPTAASASTTSRSPTRPRAPAAS